MHLNLQSLPNTGMDSFNLNSPNLSCDGNLLKVPPKEKENNGPQLSKFANAAKNLNERGRKSTFFSMKKKEDPAIKVLKKHLEPSDNRSA